MSTPVRTMTQGNGFLDIPWIASLIIEAQLTMCIL
jgi:hypothetical protein